MILRSIKWRLQLWHALILLVVLGGFGYTAFELQRTRELRRVDQQLQEQMDLLLGPLRRPGRLPVPPDGRPARGERPMRPPDRGDPDRPPRGGPPEIGRDSDGAFPEEGPFYFLIVTREGRVVRSRALPEGFSPPGPGLRPGLATRGEFRELAHATSRGETVVVGRSLAPERKEMQNLALVLAGAGAGILALGLAGGWIVATRAMRPIDTISATAQKIATGDLSQRIPHDQSQSELGRLISVLNSTFARLEAAFAEQARFTADVSHELRTPVSVIVSQTQMALARERPAPEYRESLEACQRAAQRMRGLIESLLQLSRLDAGQEEMHKAPIDLAQVARETVDLLRPLAEERGINLSAKLNPVPLSGDAGRLGQAVTNLLANAIQYTPSGGTILVEAGPSQQLAVLSVRDSGIGIPPEDLPRVFERFYRVDASRSRDKGGSGLGLAITRAIVHAHGGTIEAQSAPGEGSTFTVRLPMA